jgi:hypothetical protein
VNKIAFLHEIIHIEDLAKKEMFFYGYLNRRSHGALFDDGMACTFYATTNGSPSSDQHDNLILNIQHTLQPGQLSTEDYPWETTT